MSTNRTPTTNNVVAVISRIDPPVSRPAVEMLREFPNGFSVELEGQPSTRLYPGERSAGMLEILEGLRKLRSPVYLELDPDTRGINFLLIPLVSKVENIFEREGNVAVMLEMSQARHVLKPDNPDFGAIVELLRSAREKGSLLVVTENDAHEIIDVRPHTGEPPLQIGGGGAASDVKALRRGCIWWLCCFFRCVTPRRAKELFDLCAAQTCNPTTVPPPCIPFMYPDDGCWGRAHEMCRLMINAGAHPKKVWIDGWLHTPTKNNPACFVNWGWHVAPTLCVRRGWFHRTEEVIDPSLFTGPVSKATWKGVQGDPAATLTPTAYSVFMRPATTDPTYTQTNSVLAFYRLQLQNRSLGPSGPPPYAFC
jgi:hypothetical protein